MTQISGTFKYAASEYSTEAEAQQAVVAFKDRLDNQPSTYCTVRRLGGNAEDGWEVPVEQLSDAEILSITEGWYSVHSSLHGMQYMPISADEVLAKVQEYKMLEATFYHADKIYYTAEYTTDEDMSGYMNV
jgi:hypothetical protein